jgi:pro-sigmaK processing inhibitor BofA
MSTQLALDGGLALLALFAVLVAGEYLLAALRFAVACLFGVALYTALNYAAAGTGFSVGINPLTVLAAGVLGLPGIVLAVAARLLFGHP